MKFSKSRNVKTAHERGLLQNFCIVAERKNGDVRQNNQSG